ALLSRTKGGIKGEKSSGPERPAHRGYHRLHAVVPGETGWARRAEERLQEVLMSFIELETAFAWRCDTPDCERIAAFKPHDFFGCVAELRARGWSFHLDEDTGREDSGRTWRHYCQRCAHKRRQTSIMDQRIRSVKG